MRTPVQQIKLGFSELEEVQNKNFNSWNELDAFLRPIHCRIVGEKETGQTLGYYKTDFTLVFSDGRTYSGRYDIGSDYNTIREHVRNFCEVYGLLRKPNHMKVEHWEHFKQNHNDGAKNYRYLLENYDI